MRLVLAVIMDVILAGALAFAGFRIGVGTAPCRKTLGDCFPLTPLIVLFVLAGTILYFVVGYLAWHATPGQYVFRVPRSAPAGDDV